MSGSVPSTVVYSARSLGSVPPVATLRSYTSLTLPGFFVLAANTNYTVTVSPQTTASSATLTLLQLTAAPTSAAGLTSISLQYYNGASWASGGTTHFGFRLSDNAGVAFAGLQTWFDMQSGSTACNKTSGGGSCANMAHQGAAAPTNVFTSGLTNLAIGFTVPNDGGSGSYGLSSVGLALWGGLTVGFSGVTATAALFAGAVGVAGSAQGRVAPSGSAIATSTAAVPTVAPNTGAFFTLSTECGRWCGVSLCVCAPLPNVLLPPPPLPAPCRGRCRTRRRARTTTSRCSSRGI